MKFDRNEQVWTALVVAAVLAVLLFLNFSPTTEKHHILLQTGVISTKNIPTTVDTFANVAGPKQLLIKLREPLTSDRISRVEQQLKVKLNRYIPHNTFAVFVDELPQLNDDITWVGNMKPEYKTKLKFKTTTVEQNALLAQQGIAEEQLELYVLLAAADATPSKYEQVEQELNTMQYCPSSIKVTPVSSNKLLVRTCHANQVLEHFKNMEEVAWIERTVKLDLFNHQANGIVQNGVASGDDEMRSIWESGITGAGEIVGCGDTGIDHDMCFFNDANTPLKFNTPISNHRKIAGYFPMSKPDSAGTVWKSDTQDIANGHGTHVVGSIVGSIVHPDATRVAALKKYNGVAPDAKVAFLDIHNPSAPTLLIPDNLQTNYFPVSYSAGAKIHSSSWGCSVESLFTCEYDCNCKWSRDIPEFQAKKGVAVSASWCEENLGRPCCQLCNMYNSQARETDAFLNEHDDMTILFAAGNSGFISKEGTIATPATAKNVISVGASHTTNKGFIESVAYSDFSAVLNMLGMRSTTECCASQYKGACCPSVILDAYTKNAGNIYSQVNLAYFSSRGPAYDGRYKPEIVAPGFSVISMHSDGDINSKQCGTSFPDGGNDASLLTNRGTSMATPIAAGATALVRQYLRQLGGFPTPSGMLVKACLIHSGQPLTGMVRLDGGKTEMSLADLKYPNHLYGFGVIQLNSVLKTSNSSFELYMQDYVEIKTGEQKVYYFSSNSDTTAAFKATLVWYDKASDVSSDGTLIDNLNLDVYVEETRETSSSTWSRYVGNSGTTTAGDSYRAESDTANTIEQVNIKSHALKKDRVIAVTVRAPELVGTQKFALVVTYKGDLAKVDKGPEPPAAYIPNIFDRFFKWLATLPLLLWGVVMACCICVPLVAVVSCAITWRRFKRFNARREQSRLEDEADAEAEVPQGTVVDLSEGEGLDEAEQEHVRNARSRYYGNRQNNN